MSWTEDKAREIAATCSARGYLGGEYGVEFERVAPGEWRALRCPLCGGGQSFRLREIELRLGDWRCAACTRQGKGTGRGDLIDLVMRADGLEKADAIRRILDRGRAYLAAVASDLEVLRHAGQYFRFTRGYQPATGEYLMARGITATGELDQVFELGGNEVSVEGLLDYLRSALQRPVSLASLSRLHLAQGQKVEFCPAITAPLYEADGRFVGLHLRRCSEQAPRFINRGLSPDDRNKLVYGLHSAVVKQAITDAKRVVVGKGVFDSWAGFQAGVKNTVATLSPRVTRAQFQRLRGLEVDEILLGFTDKKEGKIVAAMAEKQDEGLHPLVYQPPGEFDLHALLHGESIESILAGAEAAVAADQRARGLAMVRRAREIGQRELNAGLYFLLPVRAVEASCRRGRKAAGELVKLLDQHRAKNTRFGQQRYLKVPHSFVDSGLHRQLGPSLRVLMYLHSKVTRPWRPVTILNHTICSDLDAALSGVQRQKQTLCEAGVLIQLPAADQRHAWQYYVFFVPAKEGQ